MNAATITLPGGGLTAPASGGAGWQRVLGIVLSVLTVGFLVYQVGEIGWGKVWAVLPSTPWFYLLFALSYLSLPVADLIIFHRLWAIPYRNIRLFLRKRVLNEALLGYSGEAYLYLWARKRPHLRVPALAAVKDVNITSALAGNIMTLALMAALVPVIGGLTRGSPVDVHLARQLTAGVVAATALSVGLLLFRGRVLSMPARDNVVTFCIHMGRLLFGVITLAAAWAVALPAIHWTVWLALSALRLIVSRLPLVPNKELLFATFGVLLAGSANVEIAALLAACAALNLAGHGIVMAYDWIMGGLEARTA